MRENSSETKPNEFPLCEVGCENTVYFCSTFLQIAGSRSGGGGLQALPESDAHTEAQFGEKIIIFPLPES